METLEEILIQRKSTFLKSGGKKHHKEALAPFGLDASDPEFWNIGLNTISSLIDEHKKKNVVGVTYKTVNVAGESGDASPSTPIGVNLPNANWIRAEVGSKSVSLGNIINAYNNSGSSGRLREFANDDNEYDLEVKHGQLADKMHTALHEVIGHASGQINPGVGTPKETLKNQKYTHPVNSH